MACLTSMVASILLTWVRDRDREGPAYPDSSFITGSVMSMFALKMPLQKIFSALQHLCDESGCNHWFRNLSGLTQHKHIAHPCLSHLHQDLPNHPRSPGCPGQEDNDMVMAPPIMVIKKHKDVVPMKSPNDWAPYHNQLQFELAKFLFAQAEMPAKKIDMQLEIWAALLLSLGREPLHANHMDLYCVIDSTSVGKVNTRLVMDKMMMAKEIIWLLGCPTPMMYGIETHDRIVSEDSTMARATLILIILGSDKTTVSVATGQTDYYPLYLSIRNIHNTICHAHCNAVVLIAFLAMSKTCILQSLHPAMKVPETVLFGDKYFQHVIYGLAAYIADYEEQALLSCTVHNWYPKCLAHCSNLDADALYCHCEHAERVINVLDLQNLWKRYGIIGDIVFIKGGFKDDLVDWVEQYLIHIHRRTEAENFLDGIDWQYVQCA
ncbi:hypothetical protein V8B97DRAFT_1917064 [Scleroderma yunnanense]